MSNQQATTSKKVKVNIPAEDNVTTSTDSSVVPKPELLTLPDVPLQGIISYIPLQPLITTVPLLHSQLALFRETTLKQNRRLILHIGDRERITELKRWTYYRLPYARHLIDTTTGKPLFPESSNFHHLYLATLEYTTLYQLRKLMPDISHLEIFIADSDILIIHDLIRLITLWLPTLLSLKLHAQFNNEHFTLQEQSFKSYLLRRLIDSINRTPSVLEHLTLDLKECIFDENDETVTLAMPILGQLREFYIYTQDRQRFILDTLRNYATDTLQKIGADLSGDWASYLEAFPAGSALASSFLYFSWDDEPTEGESFDEEEAIFHLETLFLETFTNLGEYSVHLYTSRSLSALPDLLSPLRQLTSLRIFVNSLDALSGMNASNLQLLTPLASVQTLEIRLEREEGSTHQDTACSLWAHLFPSVQILVLLHCTRRFCSICYPDGYAEWPGARITTFNPILHCIKQYVAPFTVLPSLRKMFYIRRIGGPIAEFTSKGDFVQKVDYI